MSYKNKHEKKGKMKPFTHSLNVHLLIFIEKRPSVEMAIRFITHSLNKINGIKSKI